MSIASAALTISSLWGMMYASAKPEAIGAFSAPSTFAGHLSACGQLSATRRRISLPKPPRVCASCTISSLPVFRTEATCRTELRENGLCDAQLQLQPEGYLAAGGGGIELRCDALFQLQSYVRQKLQSLSGGTLEQQTERGGSRPSVIICRCADRQELWQLAKQYRTTAHAIEAANHLTQPEVEAGRLLLIPM